MDGSPALDALADLLRGRRTAVLTGAGISTDSGIPDYRGDGSRPRRDPMTVERFLGSERDRRRYWAGSAIGWARFDAAAPNPGHLALAELERLGAVLGVATQNVDSLHFRAGSYRVVEVHGHLRTASCRNCRTAEPRDRLAARIRELNPWFDPDPAKHEIRPDGDAEVGDLERFVVPECLVCGGLLKPDVVFFGEFAKTEATRAAEQLVDEADALLVAGTSLVVNTGVRMVHRARRRGIPVAIVNRGETGVDALADLVLDAGTSETLAALAERLLPTRTGPIGTTGSGPR